MFNRNRKHVEELESELKRVKDLAYDALCTKDRERAHRIRLSKELAKSENSKREIVLENHETVAHLENDNRRLRELVRLLVKDV